ncbi:MAG: hypothetical protein AUI63_00565 [Gemmatimonadetes bacterium 13_1_40CM_2_60_3]|nr:MAG: hypothetical protein AUI63_00565 [Gemmatimonadetes bacterium 13_1_40CM_2_60_3]
MLDSQGRLWLTARIRTPNAPAYCKAGSTNPSAKRFPIDMSVRQLAMYDPKAKKITYIDTCFDTHHLMFGEDANNTLWFNGYDSRYLGWLNTKMFDETHDALKSQGWTGLILDTNGNGKRDAYVGAKDPVDPAKDKMIDDALYTAAPTPARSSELSPVQIRPRRRWRNVTSCRPRRAILHAAWMSIATASRGLRSAAATLEASTGASAPVR